MSAAETPAELVEALSLLLRQRAAAPSPPPPPPLPPLLLSTSLMRLAEYKLSEEGLFTDYIVTLDQYAPVVRLLQQELTALCRHAAAAAPGGGAGGGSTAAAHDVSLGRMSHMLWAVDVLLGDPSEQGASVEEGGGEAEDSCGDGRASPAGSGEAAVADQEALLEGVARWAAAGGRCRSSHGGGGSDGQSECDRAAVHQLTGLLCGYASLLRRCREAGGKAAAAPALVRA